MFTGLRPIHFALPQSRALFHSFHFCFVHLQVSCLNDICGMFPFISPDIPDQFYRLFTSLCLHAGLIHLAITIAFQHIFMADLERLLGPIRTAVLYIGSGVAGNLTSSIFLPYKPEVTKPTIYHLSSRLWCNTETNIVRS